MEKLTRTCDVAVVGCGGAGSAALLALASRGVDVVGVDRYTPPHDLGSSHGQTRIIRKAYFEHPNYVPLLRRSYEMWRELEQRSGRNLMHLVGALEAGPADGVLINGIRLSARTHDLPIEFLSLKESSERFPGFSFDDNFDVAFEKDAGYLLVEQCIEACLAVAVASGASLLTNTTVLDWSAASGGGIKLTTSKGAIEAGAMVLAGGSWASGLLGRLTGVRLQVIRKYMHWYSNDHPSYFASSGCPVFAMEQPFGHTHRFYYGFPQIDAAGVKLAEHTGGEKLDRPAQIIGAADADTTTTERFLRRHLPYVSGGLTQQQACLYTMSHDENFYLDTHPEYANVAYVAGLSGHGFKFSPVLGEILADLVTDTGTRHDIDFLRAARSS